MSTTPPGNTLPAFIRTSVPLLVAAGVTFLAQHGIVLDTVTSDALGVVLGGIAGVLWYGLVRVLEARWPQLGVLLGYAATPTYTAPVAPEPVVVPLTDDQRGALLAVRDALDEGDPARDAIDAIGPALVVRESTQEYRRSQANAEALAELRARLDAGDHL